MSRKSVPKPNLATIRSLRASGGVEIYDLCEYFPQPGGQTTQPIFKQNGLNVVDSRNDVSSAVKITPFSSP